MFNKVESLKDVNVAVDILNLHELFSGELLLELQNVCLAQGGFPKLAAATGLEQKNLYKILSPNENPDLNILIKIIHALGFKLKFEKKQ